MFFEDEMMGSPFDTHVENISTYKHVQIKADKWRLKCFHVFLPL